MSARRSALAVLSLLVTLAPIARAQDESASPRSRWSVGGGGGAFMPQGEFADHSGTNAVWELFVTARPRAWGPWGVRLSAQFMEHAHSDTTYALPGIDVETRTSSDLVLWTLGPELLIGRGPLRALGHAGIGVAWARTLTAIRTSTNDVGNGNDDDLTMGYEIGAALSWRLLRSELLSLELGGRWNGTGPLEYVPESGIRRVAGQLVLTPRRSRMDGVVLRAALGVSLDRMSWR